MENLRMDGFAERYQRKCKVIDVIKMYGDICFYRQVTKDIFWVSDSLTRHTIILMDFAKSILRHGATGVELKEVILTPIESIV